MCGGTSVIPTPGKLRQEDSELEASLDYLDLVSKKEKKTPHKASMATDEYLYGAQSHRALTVPVKGM